MTGMVWWPLALVFVLLWPGVALLIDSVASRPRGGRSLADRLGPYQAPASLVEEAEHWLREQR
jgi:hypothetical protein